MSGNHQGETRRRKEKLWRQIKGNQNICSKDIVNYFTHKTQESVGVSFWDMFKNICIMYINVYLQIGTHIKYIVEHCK